MREAELVGDAQASGERGGRLEVDEVLAVVYEDARFHYQHIEGFVHESSGLL
jgi:hypothetical protein